MDFLNKLGIQDHNSGTCFGHGNWADSSDTSDIDSVNPATGERIASVLSASAEAYDQVIKVAREAFQEWRTVPAPQRGEAVRLVTEALRDNKDALGSLVSLEMGKIKAEGDGEVQEMIDIGDFALGQSRMLYGNSMHSERPHHRLFEQYHPLGVVGIITAFNFPVAVWSWNALLAAVCGNVCVWKPSPKTPLTSIAVQNICDQALDAKGYPPIFQVFNDGDNALAERFVDDRRVDLVSFTGSCQVGRQVGHRVAARMGKSLLELGGNNAIIVDQSADLRLAIPGIVFGSVGTAGQRCTTTRRLIVHEDIIDSVTEQLVSAYGQVRIGDPLESETLMGPLIDEASVERFSSAVKKAQEEGGQLKCGGGRARPSGPFCDAGHRAHGFPDLHCKDGNFRAHPVRSAIPNAGQRN